MIQITYKDMYVYTKDYTYILKAKIWIYRELLYTNKRKTHKNTQKITEKQRKE